MLFYKKDGTNINYNLNSGNYITHGTQANIYKIKPNEVLKVYLDVLDENKYVFAPEANILEEINSLNLPGYYKIHDIYQSQKNNYISGYTMPYYETIKENILLLPTSYTLDSINKIFKGLSTLTDRDIEAKDLYYKNVILTKEGIVVIDVDAYTKSLKDKDVINYVNINNLLYMLRGIYKEALINLGLNPEKDRELSSRLSALLEHSNNPAKTLTRKLAWYKKPLDYLYKK